MYSMVKVIGRTVGTRVSICMRGMCVLEIPEEEEEERLTEHLQVSFEIVELHAV